MKRQTLFVLLSRLFCTMAATEVAVLRSLYRRIRRLHAHLPGPHRLLGDKVVSEEWRALQIASAQGKATPAHRHEFVHQWQQYALALRGQPAAVADEELLNAQLSAEQRAQLVRLRAEAEKLAGG